MSRDRWQVQGYWLNIFSALHERMTTQISDIISNRKDIPKLMATGKEIETILCQFHDFFMWKLKTGIISNSVYEYL